jgi:hypothetical protein
VSKKDWFFYWNVTGGNAACTCAIWSDVAYSCTIWSDTYTCDIWSGAYTCDIWSGAYTCDIWSGGYTCGICQWGDAHSAHTLWVTAGNGTTIDAPVLQRQTFFWTRV